jgi:predicted RNA-binding Zn-ribbon protein involved in translation (DUF1610 family)
MVKKGKRRRATKTARAMVTLSHYRFKQMLKHQAAKHGGFVVDVTEEYTSKTCSKCGHIHTKLNGSKIFKCPECGHTLDRHFNGACNILLKALRDIATAKTVRTFLTAKTIAITASSFFLLPSSFFLLLYLPDRKACSFLYLAIHGKFWLSPEFTGLNVSGV